MTVKPLIYERATTDRVRPSTDRDPGVLV